MHREGWHPPTLQDSFLSWSLCCSWNQTRIFKQMSRSFEVEKSGHKCTTYFGPSGLSTRHLFFACGSTAVASLCPKICLSTRHRHTVRFICVLCVCSELWSIDPAFGICLIKETEVTISWVWLLLWGLLQSLRSWAVRLQLHWLPLIPVWTISEESLLLLS